MEKIEKNFFILLLIFLGALQSCQQSTTTPKTSESEKPNIVLVMTDDQGWGDLGFHGNPDVKTPVLDDLARQSTRFTNFYVSPVCTPTRSSLMTGRYSLRTGVYDTYNGGAMMAGEEVTVAELLRETGYSTGMFGKWHLGDNYPSRPHDQGFDHALYHRSGGMAQVGDITTWFRGDSAYFDPVLLENGKEVKKQGYCSDIFTDGAIDFVDQHKDGPFFVYLSFNAPHTPLQLPQEYETMYANLEIDSSAYPPSERAFPKMNKNHLNAARKVYGMVTNIDDNLGRLLQKLDDLGLSENTLFIFITDNGPQQVRYTGVFRGRKGSVYEGGVRVPCFMRFPAKFSADKEIDIPAAHYDLLPTFLDLTNISKPDNVDGQSLLPLINGETVDWEDRPLFFHWQRGFPEPFLNTAMRKGKYKLVGHKGYLSETVDLELYDLENDPSELHNLNTEKPEIVQELRKEYEAWHAEMIKSKNLGTVRIVLGSDEENPSILNRNDAGGSWGIWSNDETFGYWDVKVQKAGYYNITCIFQDDLESAGRMSVRIGKVQRSFDNTDKTDRVLLEKVWLPESDCRVEAGYRESENRRRVLFPFYLEVERVE